MQLLLIAGLFALWVLISFKITQFFFLQNLFFRIIASPVLASLYSLPLCWYAVVRGGDGWLTAVAAIPFGFLAALPFVWEIWATVLVWVGVKAYRSATNSSLRISSIILTVMGIAIGGLSLGIHIAGGQLFLTSHM